MPTNSDILRYGELLAYKKENEELSKNVVAWESCSHAWKRKLKLIKEEKENLQTENGKLKSKLSEHQISEQSESFKQLQLENDHLKLDNNALTNSIKELEVIIVKCKSDEIIFQKKISDFENDLQIQTKFFNDEKLKLLDTIDSLEEENELVKQESRGLQTAHDVLTQKLDKRSQPTVIIPDKHVEVDHTILNAQIEAKFLKIEKKVTALNMKMFEQKVSEKANSQVNVSKKIYPCKSSKPFVKKVSQFTTYSLQKAKKYSEKQYTAGTSTFSSFLSFSDNSSFISNAHNRMKNREWKRQPKVSSSTTQAKSFSYTFTKLFELAPRPVCPVVQQVNDFVLKNPPIFKTPTSFKSQSQTKDFQSPLLPRKLFQTKTPCFSPSWNAMSVHQIDSTYIWSSKMSTTIRPGLKWVRKVVSK